jgi:hypothetical protein
VLQAWALLEAEGRSLAVRFILDLDAGLPSVSADEELLTGLSTSCRTRCRRCRAAERKSSGPYEGLE